MHLRKRVLLHAAIILATVFILNCLFAILAQQKSFDMAKDSELANVAKFTTSALQGQEIIAAGSAEIISNQPGIAKLFREGDRDGLQKMLWPMFERMHTLYGASILQLFTPPAEALLFVENPKMPITDFRDTRPMVIAANVSGVRQQGLELGPVGLAIRAITPIKDDAGLIGVVEYASDYHVQLKRISNLTDTQMVTFINEDLWDKARKKDKEFTPVRDQVIAGKRAVYSTDWELTSAVVMPPDLAPTRGNHTATREYNKAEYGVLSMPLIDFSGQQIGLLVGVRNFAKLKAEFIDSVRLAVMRALLGFTVAFGSMSIIFNCFLMRPLADLLDKLRAVNQGTSEQPLSLPWRTDEIGELFQEAEKMRLKLPANSNVIANSDEKDR